MPPRLAPAPAPKDTQIAAPAPTRPAVAPKDTKVAVVAPPVPGTLPSAVSAPPVTRMKYEDASQRLVRTFNDHRGQVSSVSFSPDGSKALSGNSEFIPVLWDIATGQEVRAYGKSPSRPTLDPVVAFSPDGTKVISQNSSTVGSNIFELKLWDVASGHEVLRFPGDDSIQSLAFSRDGTRFLTGGYNREVKLWELATGRELRTFGKHKWYVTAVSFSASGGQALSLSTDGVLKTWDVATGRELSTMQGPKDWSVSRSSRQTARRLSSTAISITISCFGTSPTAAKSAALPIGPRRGDTGRAKSMLLLFPRTADLSSRPRAPRSLGSTITV